MSEHKELIRILELIPFLQSCGRQKHFCIVILEAIICRLTLLNYKSLLVRSCLLETQLKQIISIQFYQDLVTTLGEFA